jgi:two-component system sensor histidine kinase HydH
VDNIYPQINGMPVAMVKGRKKIRFDISLWVAISAIAVLIIITTVMAMAQFERQKTKVVEIFVEKGATLIRSFEAGLQDAADEKSRVFNMQKLLIATAQQPDIDYIIITENKGSIIADSDPSMIGQKYGLDLDITQIGQSTEIRWRQSANPQGADTFEVYRGLFPQYLGYQKQTQEEEKFQAKFVVYVGFNMDKIAKAATVDTRNTIIRIIVLFIVGSLAIVSLFLVQAYRLTRSTLSRMQAFSETLVKNMPIGLIALDDAGKIISCNEKAQEVLNGFCSNVLGSQADEILPTPLKEMLAELPEQCGLLERDVDVSSLDGGKQKWEAVAAGLIDEDTSVGKILLMRDVTQIRELEKEVIKSRHLTSISSLAAGVAHEIRNPLSSIKGFAIYLKERLQADSEDKKTADIIVDEVERLNRVITQLIEFARPMELKKEKARISDLVGHALKLIETETQKNNIKINVAPGNNGLFAEVDPDKVKQVLLNIFLNALAAMKNGGSLDISIFEEKKNVQVVVKDTGTGIEQKNLPRIYDPYFTSKPAGTGLGLAVVQKIMEAHGGKISVESTTGKGTKVSLYFPR